MTWERMTIDEYAAFEKAVKNKVIKINGVWWRETKKVFYRPLNIFQEIQPERRFYPPKYWVGGIQHVVPSLQQSNCHLNLFVFDDLQGYSIESISHVRRRRIKKGLKEVTIKPIEDLDEFIESGHRIYESFYNRTGYVYKKNRKKEEGFKKWAIAVFGFPKVVLLGAYRTGKLCAVSISLLVEEVLINATYFGSKDSLELYAADAVLHTIRENAKNVSGIKYIYLGMSSDRKGVDEFKRQRGCRLLSLPARFQLNPLILLYLKHVNKSKYQRLLGRKCE
jgi:hypothetical protein